MTHLPVHVFGTPVETASAAADLVDHELRTNPAAVLGLATGSTPLRMYDELARRHREAGLSFAHAHGYLLDEYLGLPPTHPQRYRHVILRELADRVGMPAAHVHAPPVDGDDLAAACADYERALVRAGGVDLQVLGLGSDGHIAFNMPGAALDSTTRVTTLSAQTVRDNARFFDGDESRVPRQAVTQGLATILRARQIVLIVTGEKKAPALRDLLDGPVTTQLPATALRAHPRVHVLADRAAAHLLSRGASTHGRVSAARG